VATEEQTFEQRLDRELSGGLDLLDALSTTDRMHVRAAVDKLARSIEEIRTERLSIEEEDPASHLGPLLGEKLRELQDLRLTLLFTVVFGEFEFLDDDDPVDQAGNIVVDGVPLAYGTLF